MSKYDPNTKDEAIKELNAAWDDIQSEVIMTRPSRNFLVISMFLVFIIVWPKAQDCKSSEAKTKSDD
jgi:hypothetical protein